MQSNEFELAFSRFLESKTYDDNEAAFFDLMRSAFCAGWTAATGTMPEEPDRVIYLMHKKQD